MGCFRVKALSNGASPLIGTVAPRGREATVSQTKRLRLRRIKVSVLRCHLQYRTQTNARGFWRQRDGRPGCFFTSVAVIPSFFQQTS